LEIFYSGKVVVNAPRFTTHPPRIHHDLTITFHPKIPKPLEKMDLYRAGKKTSETEDLRTGDP
jgi:hypothetical protein